MLHHIQYNGTFTVQHHTKAGVEIPPNPNQCQTVGKICKPVEGMWKCKRKHTSELYHGLQIDFLAIFSAGKEHFHISFSVE